MGVGCQELGWQPREKKKKKKQQKPVSVCGGVRACLSSWSDTFVTSHEKSFEFPGYVCVCEGLWLCVFPLLSNVAVQRCVWETGYKHLTVRANARLCPIRTRQFPHKLYLHVNSLGVALNSNELHPLKHWGLNGWSHDPQSRLPLITSFEAAGCTQPLAHVFYSKGFILDSLTTAPQTKKLSARPVWS